MKKSLAQLYISSQWCKNPHILPCHAFFLHCKVKGIPIYSYAPTEVYNCYAPVTASQLGAAITPRHPGPGPSCSRYILTLATARLSIISTYLQSIYCSALFSINREIGHHLTDYYAGLLLLIILSSKAGRL